MTIDTAAPRDGVTLLILLADAQPAFLHGLSLLSPAVSRWVAHDVSGADHSGQIQRALSGAVGSYAQRAWAGERENRRDLIELMAATGDPVLLLDSQTVITEASPDLVQAFPHSGLVEFSVSHGGQPRWRALGFRGCIPSVNADGSLSLDELPLTHRSAALRGDRDDGPTPHGYASAAAYLRRARAEASSASALRVLDVGVATVTDVQERAAIRTERAVLLRHLDRLPDSLADLVLARDETEDPRTEFEWARTLNALGAHRAAEEAMSIVVARASAVNAPDDIVVYAAAARMEQGLAAFHRGDRERAKVCFEAVRDDPRSTDHERSVAISNVALCA